MSSQSSGILLAFSSRATLPKTRYQVDRIFLRRPSENPILPLVQPSHQPQRAHHYRRTMHKN